MERKIKIHVYGIRSKVVNKFRNNFKFKTCQISNQHTVATRKFSFVICNITISIPDRFIPSHVKKGVTAEQFIIVMLNVL